jgi:predicted ribonuclease YlaK
LKEKPSNHLKLRIDDLKVFEPLTNNQRIFFDEYKAGKRFMALHGVAGTGKTFCAMYKALEEVLDRDNSFQKIVVVRSAVQSRDMGHLPGSVEEKMSIYTQPYIQICDTLFGRKDAWDRLEEQGHIEFISTSFIRGMTFDHTIIIVDEMQNMNFEEIDTIMTRVGHKSKIIWCGDYRQTDLKKAGDKTGILKFLDIAQYVKSFVKIEFAVEDIVRSGLVREYIIARLSYEDKATR